MDQTQPNPVTAQDYANQALALQKAITAASNNLLIVLNQAISNNGPVTQLGPLSATLRDLQAQYVAVLAKIPASFLTNANSVGVGALTGFTGTNTTPITTPGQYQDALTKAQALNQSFQDGTIVISSTDKAVAIKEAQATLELTNAQIGVSKYTLTATAASSPTVTPPQGARPEPTNRITPPATNSTATSQISALAAPGLTPPSTFRIYLGCDTNATSYYEMDLLPAVKSNMRVHTGSNGDGQEVPGAMPGIMFLTTQNVARIDIPGGSPVIQSLGVNSEVATFVGAFIGRSRNINDKSKLLGTDAAGLLLNELSEAWQASEDFVNTVVKPGKVITIDIVCPFKPNPAQSSTFNNNMNPGTQSDPNNRAMRVTKTGIIVKIQRLAARQDKLYYEFNFLTTKYNLRPKTTVTSTPTTPVVITKEVPKDVPNYNIQDPIDNPNSAGNA
jgi:hypothetical protein